MLSSFRAKEGKMSDSVEIAAFDVEAQESLLEASAEEGVSEAETTSNSARKTLLRFILLVRSTELFKLGANYAADITSSSSTSASYASITSSDEIITQGSGIVAALEVSADSTHEDILRALPASDNYEHNIELQQRNNVTEIVKKKNLQDLHNFGGVRGVAEALNTDLEKGKEISSPREISQCKPSNISQFLLTFFRSFLRGCNNYTIFLLSCAAVLSLGFGIKEEGLHMGWFNGGVLLVTIFMIVIGTTIHKFWEEWSHKKLENSWHSKGRKLQVRVIRGGDFHLVREIDLEVGDIAVLQKGDQVPADGLFVTGQALELDEGLIKSTTIDERKPFMFYGSRVINGNARMLVTSTLMDTVWGEMMSQAMEESADKECKFESYLHKLYNCVHISGLLISILIVIVFFLRYKAGKLDDERRFRPDSKGEPTPVRTIVDAIKGIITGSRGTARVLTTLLSVSLLGIMEGIPFAISVAAIIWNRKTLAHKACEIDYLACIKMACVTTICTDKFGGKMEHEKEIDKFYVGEEFVSESSVVASEVLEGLCDGIGTLFLITPNDQESKLLPLISWAEEKLGMKRDSVIEQCKMIRYSGRDPLQEPCQVLMEKNGNGGYLHCKGPPQDILSMCSHHYGIDGRIREIDAGKRRMLEQEVIGYMLAEETEVISYACKHVEDFDEASVEPNHLIFLAMISMKETKMEDTKEAVSNLKEAGIRTILASGDDIAVLQPIGAQKYGLLANGSDDLVLRAEEFRAWTDEEKMEKVEKICILGNCLPSDKILLIKCLREKGQVVALLAQRSVDAPALKQADIGITFGTWSSEVARECCDISIWDCNCFTFLVKIIKNGRCFQENIRKFIQLQLIFAISSSLINFTAVVFWGDAPITAVQLFWLNLVVGLVGGLALLTGPVSTTVTTMQLSLESSVNSLITKAMWRNIAIQASYQTTMFVSLQHKGHSILGISGGRVKSIIYNGFFLCQMFNKFIAREPEKKNIFSGLFHNMNCWFWVALVIFIICQAVFAVAEEVVGSSPGLNLKLWGACFLIGLVSWLLDWAGKIATNFISRWAALHSGTTCKLKWITSLSSRPFNQLSRSDIV